MPMVCLWMSMVRLWYAYGMSMVCFWHAYGMSSMPMVCLVYAYGMSSMPMVCLWQAYGMPVIWLWYATQLENRSSAAQYNTVDEILHLTAAVFVFKLHTYCTTNNCSVLPALQHRAASQPTYPPTRSPSHLNRP